MNVRYAQPATPARLGASSDFDKLDKTTEDMRRWHGLCDLIGLYVSMCQPDNPYKNRALTPADADHPSPSKILATYCTDDVARTDPRYWIWANAYPTAREIRPNLFAPKGAPDARPLPPTGPQIDQEGNTYDPDLTGVTMGMSSDEAIALERKRNNWRNGYRSAVIDWLYRNGVNAYLMDYNEVADHVRLVLAAGRGDPAWDAILSQGGIVPAAYFVPGLTTTTPSAPGPQSRAGVLETIKRNWPGIAAGAILALIKGGL